jgi:hypothetical protein
LSSSDRFLGESEEEYWNWWSLLVEEHQPKTLSQNWPRQSCRCWADEGRVLAATEMVQAELVLTRVGAIRDTAELDLASVDAAPIGGLGLLRSPGPDQMPARVTEVSRLSLKLRLLGLQNRAESKPWPASSNRGAAHWRLARPDP